MRKKKKILTIADKVNMRKRELQLKETLDLENDEKVVVEEKGKISTILSFLSAFAMFLVKTAILLLLIVLSTVGATVLLNSELRNVFFNLINLNI